jgi:hypothetical protein
LAAAATTEKTTLTQLVENNATLTANVAALTASLVALTTAYTLLLSGKTPPAQPAKAANDKQPAKPCKGIDPNGYCWTHGFRVVTGHSSATCNSKAEGHKDAATRANIMGGSTKNQNNST